MKIAVTGLLIALASLLMSGVVYRETRPPAQLQRNQDQHMAALSDSAYFLAYFMSFARDIIDENELSDDAMEHLYAVIQSQAQLLAGVVREGFSLGLAPDIVGEHDYSSRDFTALLILLNYLSTINPSESRIEDIVSSSGVCALVRFLNQIVKYEHRGLFRGEDIKSLIEKVQNETDCLQDL